MTMGSLARLFSSLGGFGGRGTIGDHYLKHHSLAAEFFSASPTPASVAAAWRV